MSSTRSGDRYRIWPKSPRRLWHSSMTTPVWWLGAMTMAARQGSATDSISAAGGISEGFDTTSTAPPVTVTRYSTEGAVEMRDRSNSRSRRSRTISMCSRPKKPQRNPKPSAPDDSGS